jgi:hypothetical protein
MIEVTVEPPLVESVVGERSDGSIVVSVRLSGDVEAVHARVEERGMPVHVTCEQRKQRKQRESEHVESGLNQSEGRE